ncbi:hypothetical protein MLD52_06970 [Puniceicoccaceae bacterium K14]|nr:hypothetical protein [Puniceicoccaceae bacterium K14]
MTSTQSIFKRLTMAFAICGFALSLKAQVVTTFISDQPMVGDGMAVDSRGNLYVAGGQGSDVVWKISTLGFAAEFGGTFNEPTGIALDSDDNLFVGTQDGIIYKIAPDGSKEEFVTGLYAPSGIAVDGEGNVYVTQYWEAEGQLGTEIFSYAPDGSERLTISSGVINGPVGITVDPVGNVYFANWASNTIYLVPSSRPSPRPFAVLEGVSRINQINYSKGFIYVPAPGEERILRVGLGGISEVFAGTGNTGESDGLLQGATFSTPNSIAANADGDVLYVNDDATNNIRKILLPKAPQVTTLVSNQPLIADGMDLDSEGNFYIAAGNGGSILWKATPEGEFTEFANGISRAVGVVVDADDNVYVGNYGSGEVSKVTPEGVKTAFATGLDGPAGLAFDSAGNLYVNQFGANGSGTGAVITRITPEGESSVFASGGLLQDGIGIAIDEDDNVYFSNWVGGSVYKIPSGSTTPELLADISEIGNINQITYSGGYIYVPGPLDDVIYRVDRDGKYELFAGNGFNGSADGSAFEASFSRPNSITVDDEKSVVYVVDTTSNNLRKIELPKISEVSTLAPTITRIGDGLAVDAEGDIFIASGNGDSIVWKVTPEGDFEEFANGFDYAVGVAIDEDQNVFVNNYTSNVLTKMTPEGVKSEFATELSGPAGLAIDSVGNIYVTEFGVDFRGDGARITRFTPEGERSVFAEGGFLKDVIGIVIDEDDNVYFTNLKGGNVYKIPNGSSESELFAEIPGNPDINQITYSNGYIYIPAITTNRIYRIDQRGNVNLLAGSDNAGFDDGVFEVATFSGPSSIAANAAGDKLYVIDGQPTSTLRVLNLVEKEPSELVNLSVRAYSGAGERTLILGFVAKAYEDTTDDSGLLVRGVGPSLDGFGVENWAEDPTSSIMYDGVEVGLNNNWADFSDQAGLGTATTESGAFTLLSGSNDSAFLDTIRTGSNTVHITDSAGGVALGEVYKLAEDSGRLVNLSCRTYTDEGEDVLIGGFVLEGGESQKILIRGIGPGLADQDVVDYLSDPELTLYSGFDEVATNSDWSDDDFDTLQACFEDVGAFSLAQGSADAAMIVELDPGAYTVHVDSVGGGTGVVLLEIYIVEK